VSRAAPSLACGSVWGSQVNGPFDRSTDRQDRVRSPSPQMSSSPGRPSRLRNDLYVRRSAAHHLCDTAEVEPRRREPRHDVRRDIDIREKPHAAEGRTTVRPDASQAAYRRHSEMSSGSSSGNSSITCAELLPAARYLSTTETGIRRPRTHGCPLHTPGSAVMRVRSGFIAQDSTPGLRTRKDLRRRAPRWLAATPGGRSGHSRCLLRPRGTSSNDGVRMLVAHPKPPRSLRAPALDVIWHLRAHVHTLPQAGQGGQPEGAYRARQASISPRSSSCARISSLARSKEPRFQRARE
jgi:hypothetical protein